MTSPHTHADAPARGVRARVRRISPTRLLPEEARRHLRNATREQLLATRSVLDAVVARLERAERRQP